MYLSICLSIYLSSYLEQIARGRANLESMENPTIFGEQDERQERRQEGGQEGGCNGRRAARSGHSTQQHPTAPNSTQQHPTAPNSTQQQADKNGDKKERRQAVRRRTQCPTARQGRSETTRGKPHKLSDSKGLTLESLESIGRSNTVLVSGQGRDLSKNLLVPKVFVSSALLWFQQQLLPGTNVLHRQAWQSYCRPPCLQCVWRSVALTPTQTGTREKLGDT